MINSIQDQIYLVAMLKIENKTNNGMSFTLKVVGYKYITQNINSQAMSVRSWTSNALSSTNTKLVHTSLLKTTGSERVAKLINDTFLIWLKTIVQKNSGY